MLELPSAAEIVDNVHFPGERGLRSLYTGWGGHPARERSERMADEGWRKHWAR